MGRLGGAVEWLGVRAVMGFEWLETGATFNPLDPVNQRDPYPMYQRVRTRDPIHRSRPIDGWIFTRHRDVYAALRDDRFSAEERGTRDYERSHKQLIKAGIIEPDFVDTPPMLRVDPPDHTRLRALVSKAFTLRAVERLRPRVQEIVDSQLDELAGRGEFDLVADFGAPVPVTVIAEMLGIPAEDRVRFRALSDEVVAGLGPASLEDRRRGVLGSRALESYLEEVIEKRRIEPRDDLISALVQAEEGGDRLTTPEVYSNVILLLVAGNETTTNLIGNGVLALLRHPDQLALLREDLAGRIESAVEEVLRFDSPVQNTSRFMLEDVEWEGVTLKKGQQVALSLGAANRDPEVFEDPDRFDVRRDPNPHLSFSQGRHLCLGAQLARLEGQIALRGLLERFPALSLAVPPESLEWGGNVVLRGLKSLPVRTG